MASSFDLNHRRWCALNMQDHVAADISESKYAHAYSARDLFLSVVAVLLLLLLLLCDARTYCSVFVALIPMPTILKQAQWSSSAM